MGFWDDDRAAPFEEPVAPVDGDAPALSRGEGRVVVSATVLANVLFAVLVGLTAPAIRSDDASAPPVGFLLLFGLVFLLGVVLSVIGRRYRRRRRPGIVGELTLDWRLIGEAVRVSGWLPAACWIAVVGTGALAFAAILPLVTGLFF